MMRIHHRRDRRDRTTAVPQLKERGHEIVAQCRLGQAADRLRALRAWSPVDRRTLSTRRRSGWRSAPRAPTPSSMRRRRWAA